ncbi:hypothetical protein Ahy_B03g067832 isoform E [Arachis hypogaea]|uniref:Uncharacterized protein n=1 Tax=Arachis hypogaea TaxID=3818 RepID=A0A445A7T9_ARAHY|nr:hypothetical protein Ahy_B03g067832 isoform E [Arachis hypogaea]
MEGSFEQNIQQERISFETRALTHIPPRQLLTEDRMIGLQTRVVEVKSHLYSWYRVRSVEEGISKIKEKLSKKRALIVLDDVDKIEQLKALAGECDWFSYGTRIVITTRDKYLLAAHEVEKIYETKLLSDPESLELFCWNAFKMTRPKENYEDLSNQAIHYAQGLPLALKVIGSNLINKNLEEWKSALDKYEKNPPKDIQSVLRVSYDSLEGNEKDIFLDIACFFNGKKWEYVKNVLDGCGMFTEDGIRILVDKSLLTINDGYLRMHDLIQNMGREIEAPREVSDRSRLWFHEDVLELLPDDKENKKIEGIKLVQCEEHDWTDTALEKMKKLRILILRNTNLSCRTILLPEQLRLLDWKGTLSI